MAILEPHGLRKTTTVRKLLPETWGFLCPVHTPDGAPCGLLNHLAHSCRPVVQPASEHSLESILEVLQHCGCELWSQGHHAPVRTKHAWICVDGRPVAFSDRPRLAIVAAKLRSLKLEEPS